MRLVFLNGWAASSAMLDSFKSQLPASYDLIILDDLYQFELAEIVTKIDELMTADTVLVGWSLGGMLALYYASLRSGKHQAKALILLNASACFLERPDYTEGVKREEFDGLRQVVQAQDSNALVRLFTHLLVDGSQAHKEDRRLLKQVFNAQVLPSWKTLVKGLGFLEVLDLRTILNSIQQPMLCMLGENDALISASLISESSQKNTHFTVKIIPGMGHFPFGMFAEKVTSSIVDYLTSLNEKSQS
tara:strand:- start:504 stop:1241 length:738 start_codon:yes stop_codon:yes gene_type:complete